jgi:hypothetical protein
MAWYAGHVYVMNRLAEQVRQQEGESARKPRSDPHIEQRLNADIAALLEQDLANVEAGIAGEWTVHRQRLASLI